MRLNRNIAIIGFGELGIQFENLLETESSVKFDHYFDDNQKKSKIRNSSYFEEYINNTSIYYFVIGLGYRYLVNKTLIIEEIKKRGGKFCSIVSSASFVSNSAQIEDGVVIYPMCNIDKNAIIKSGVLLNNSVVVSHDCIINESCYLSPGVVLSGDVKIGKNTFIGTGVVISNGVSIGENCTIGIGSVITKDVLDRSSVIGNPARILKSDLTLR